MTVVVNDTENVVIIQSTWLSTSNNDILSALFVIVLLIDFETLRRKSLID